jgi:hypothetical protein
VKDCGISLPIATPTVDRLRRNSCQRLATEPPFALNPVGIGAVCQISVARKCERLGFG